MSVSIILFLLFALFAAGIGPVLAQGLDVGPPKGYVCYRALHPIVMDGTLNDPAWNDAPWTDDFLDIQGPTLRKPRFRTRAKMLWDDNYLYVGAYLEEPQVWATLTDHDSVIFRDNDFEVFMDPDWDNQNYYEIETNAFGTEWDLLLWKAYRDGGPPLNQWEIPGLKVATHVDGNINDPSTPDKGWSIELAFPWSALAVHANRPAPPHDGDQWRINFSRVEWHVTVQEGKYAKVPNTPEDNWVWSPQGQIDMHRPERWGYLQFSTAKPGTAKFHPDSLYPVREWLTKLYYAEHAYQKTHGNWTANISDLDLPPPPSDLLAGPPTIEILADGNAGSGNTRTFFRATAECKPVNGKRIRLNEGDDSRQWAEVLDHGVWRANVW
jgi:hypothetical protein